MSISLKIASVSDINFCLWFLAGNFLQFLSDEDRDLKYHEIGYERGKIT